MLLCTIMSCNEDEFMRSESDGSTEGAVGFSITSMETKSAPVMQLSELKEFSVIALQHDGVWEKLNVSGPASVFMNHIRVLQTPDNKWSYTPLKYWPANKNITFFGYAPEAATDGTFNKYGMSITTPIDGNLPVITYKVPKKVEDQPDLMISGNQNYNLNKSDNGNGNINFNLRHALTCVGFNASGSGERITGIKISGVAGAGSVKLGTETINWDINPDDTSYEFEAGVNNKVLDNDPGSILNGNGYLMMIPQTLTDQAKIVVTIDDGNGAYEQSFSLNIPGNDEWVAGRLVEYKIAITSTEPIIITPDNIVLTALKGSYSSFSVICPDKNPDGAWTVTVPEGEWLQICDNMNGTNTSPQESKYTYSGRGSTTLFAFAPSANALTTSLTSSIKLKGTTQAISVSQLGREEIYYPTYPHGGWAGSNIYWVEDSSYPDGGYLTFDDQDVTEHEQYQGVYFMWGSLVALSPSGDSWTGGIWNGSAGQVLYIPNQDPATNGGWTNISNPNGGGSAVNLVYNDLQSYLYQNHNSQQNVGDICKYITDMGWAPGAEEGRKWRMPTHKEFNNISSDYAKITPFAYQQSGNRFGHSPYSMGFRRTEGLSTPFFPTSGFRYPPSGSTIAIGAGYRPGESFTYWTSSPNKINGDAFDYIMSNSMPTNIQGFVRNTGATVRCVREGKK